MPPKKLQQYDNFSLCWGHVKMLTICPACRLCYYLFMEFTEIKLVSDDKGCLMAFIIIEVKNVGNVKF